MLKIINNPLNIAPIKMQFSNHISFFQGNIAKLNVSNNNIVELVSGINGLLGSQAFGIFDDTFDLIFPGNNTVNNGVATVWQFHSSLEIETDLYDYSVKYAIGDNLYPSIYGNFTTSTTLSSIPIGVVTDSPNVNNAMLKVKFLSQFLSQNQNVQSSIPPTLNNNSITTTGTTTGITWVKFNTGSVTVMPQSSSIYYLPPSLFDKKDIIEKDPPFDGIKLPNGSTGSICKNCGNCNEFILERNYICYNCK